MAANEHLNEQLFHGSTHWFTPDETVNPGRRDDYYGPDAYTEAGFKFDRNDGIGAYATTNIEEARKFAQQGLTYKMEDDLRAGKNHQLEMFAPVFAVSHLSEHSDPWGRLMGAEDTPREQLISGRHRPGSGGQAARPNYRRDKVGFKVEGSPVDFVNRDFKGDEDAIRRMGKRV